MVLFQSPHQLLRLMQFNGKDNKKIIIQKFADLSIYLPVQNPTTYFMAGSPGAGKTEYSKSFIKELLVHFTQTEEEFEPIFL